MKPIIRRQLTLFINKESSYEIEAIRKQFNPIQQELIDSHVTLCREDEIEDLNALLNNLDQLNVTEITINFGQAERFDNGAGVLLPSFGDNNEFHLLRSKVLEGLCVPIRRHEPHITLMHPRNSNCTNEIFSIIRNVHLPAQLTFDTISLIEQVNGGKWQILKSYKLKSSN